jgi:hypothetical protein
MLTDLESVFRSLRSELGLRPVFHSKEKRTDGHLKMIFQTISYSTEFEVIGWGRKTLVDWTQLYFRPNY